MTHPAHGVDAAGIAGPSTAEQLLTALGKVVRARGGRRAQQEVRNLRQKLLGPFDVSKQGGSKQPSGNHTCRGFSPAPCGFSTWWLHPVLSSTLAHLPCQSCTCVHPPALHLPAAEETKAR
jgi:hypothetical protein